MDEAGATRADDPDETPDQADERRRRCAARAAIGRRALPHLEHLVQYVAECAGHDGQTRLVMEALARIEARCGGAAAAGPAGNVSALDAAWGDD